MMRGAVLDMDWKGNSIKCFDKKDFPDNKNLLDKLVSVSLQYNLFLKAIENK